MNNNDNIIATQDDNFYIMNRKVYFEIIECAKELTPFSIRQVFHKEHGMLFNAYKIDNRVTNKSENFTELFKLIRCHKANLKLAGKVAKLDLSSIKKVALGEFENYDKNEWIVLANGHEHNGSELVYDIRVWRNFAIDVCKIYKHKFVANEIQSLINYFEVSLTILAISEPNYELDFAKGDMYLPIVHQTFFNYILEYILKSGGVIMFQ